MEMISVIVPIYYGKKYMNDMIRQIEAASYYTDYKIELVFVNDAPDEIIEGYFSDKLDIVLIDSKVNRGIHGARVKGLESAKGQYIVFLDQDDKIEPLYFSSQIDKLKNNDAVVCFRRHWRNLGYSTKDEFAGKMFLNNFISEGNLITSPGQVLIKRTAIPEIWQKEIMQNNGADDWFLWICMLKFGCVISVNEDELYEHILHNNNESSNESKMSKSEQEMFDIINSNHILSESEQIRLEKCIKEINAQRINALDKQKKKLKLYGKWFDLHRKGKYIGDYLDKRNIRSVSIYGAADIGQQIYKELTLNNIKVDCFIDRRGCSVFDLLPVVELESYNFESDMIIVSIIDFDESTKHQLAQKYNTSFCSIDEIIDELMNENDEE